MHRRSSVVAFVTLAVVAAGCGGSEKKSSKPAAPKKPTVVEFKATGEGKASKLEGPTTVKSGLVELRLTNDSKKGDHTAQILSLKPPHTADEAVTAGEAWGEKGTPLPPWMKLVGGMGSLEPGDTEAVTLALPKGKYVLLDIETNVNAPLEVTGAPGTVPPAKATITATEYKFTGSKLKAGQGKILFKNAGKQPHHLLAAPIKEGKTIQDVQKFFTDEAGDAPIDEAKSFDTGILDGGKQQLIDVDLQAGRYVMFCFVPDRTGGPPHALKGMISQVSVTE